MLGMYKSSFSPSAQATRVLTTGRILGDNETPQQMIERVVASLTEVEAKFGTATKEIFSLQAKLGYLLDEKYYVLSTPILTNAGRYLQKPLSACTVPPIDLAHDDIAKVREVVTRMHQDGMGTGFSLNGLADPVATLRVLNKIAVESASSGKEDRPVGNMATLSVYDKKIYEFINAKVAADQHNEQWKFNISVDCDSNFFKQLEIGGKITLLDGNETSAQKLFDEICNAAVRCADPGLMFLDRMEEDNPTPIVGRYISTAPCAEVGLTKGEACQFGYINVAKFIDEWGNIDTQVLANATQLLTRILDNALEISIDNYSEEESKVVMTEKRKIGIGICGLADLFVKKRVLYSSYEARVMALDLVSFINYESKRASHELAKKRGSFGAMRDCLGNKHLSSPSTIEKRYGELSTRYVAKEDWVALAETIRETKQLRNASTIALPPTGRSALTVDASTGIEPIFSYHEYLELHPNLNASCYEFLQTAKNISPAEHLLMASEIQKGVDESISKTINLPSSTTAEDIESIYVQAWQLGLKGISVYREGSKNTQPRHLS